jgi:flagellar biosynthesis/type III secretory pathway protein FliH
MEIIQARFRPNSGPTEQIIIQAHALMQQVDQHLATTLQKERKALATNVRRMRQRCRRQAQAQAQKKINLSLVNQIQSLNKEHQERLKNSQRDLLALVIKYTEQLTANSVSKDCSGLTKKIQTSLKLLSKEQTLRISVNPSHIDEVQQLLGVEAKGTIEAQPKLAFGVAEITTPVGKLTIDWRTELSTLREKLGF